MAVPVWPTELPQRAVTDGYTEGLRDGRMFSAMSSGPPKVRRRFSSAVLPVTLVFRVDYTQKSRLETFWNEDTSGGSLPFIMPDQTHDGIPLLDDDGIPILDASNNPILVVANWLCLFSQQAPQFTPFGREFNASLTLSVLP